MAKTYKWPSGGGHSIPYAKHQKNVKARARTKPGGAKPDATKAGKAPLTKAQKRKRWWGQPIMAGADVTNRQAAKQARAATTTRYAPLVGQQRRAVGEARTFQRDLGGFYDDYLNRVRQQSENVNQIGQQAQQAVAGTQAGVTGLANTDLTQLNQAATQDAQARGATPGDLAQMASGAAATRQALVGSFAAQQAATNAANQTYASNRANVVAPGQRLGAVVGAQGRLEKARSNLADTFREKGAYKQTQLADIRESESKNVLARGALNLKSAAQLADEKLARDKLKAQTAADKRRAAATAKAGSPQTAGAKAMATTAAKYGYTAQQWKALGAAGRAKVISSAKSRPADSVYTSGAFAGRKKSEVNGMSPAKRQQLVDAYNSGKGPGGKKKDGKGPKLLTPGQSGAGLTQLANLKDLMGKAKGGQLFEKGTGNPPPLGRYAGQTKVSKFASNVKHPALVRAAADAVYDGHISAYTQKQLQTAGYRAADVAKALGVPTHGQYVNRKTTTGRNTRAYARGRGGYFS